MTDYEYEVALDERLLESLLNEWDSTVYIFDPLEGLDDLPDTDLYGNSYDEEGC